MPWIVYETTNLINGKKYRGVHEQDGEDFDGYLGSGDLIIRAIEKHGRDNFSRTTMFVFEVEADAYKQEAVVVDEAWCNRDDTYNVRPGGVGGFPWYDPEYRAAQSARMKAIHARPDYRALQSSRMKALCADPNWLAANSASIKAACADPEYRAAQSSRMKAVCAGLDWRAATSARMKASWARRRLNKANEMLFIIG